MHVWACVSKNDKIAIYHHFAVKLKCFWIDSAFNSSLILSYQFTQWSFPNILIIKITVALALPSCYLLEQLINTQWIFSLFYFIFKNFREIWIDVMFLFQNHNSIQKQKVCAKEFFWVVQHTICTHSHLNTTRHIFTVGDNHNQFFIFITIYIKQKQ